LQNSAGKKKEARMKPIQNGIVFSFAFLLSLFSLSSFAAVGSAANNVSSRPSAANNVDNSQVQPGSAQNPVTTTPSNPPTAQNQSTSTNDAELTRRIRADLMSRNLSTQAKNVTIVTVDGMVTIRGTVPTSEEKATIGEVATRFAPNVRNDVVVKR
jgi:osmotically-inducible protein OsmY